MVEEACTDPNFFATIKNNVKRTTNIIAKFEDRWLYPRYLCAILLYIHIMILRLSSMKTIYWNDMELKLTEFYFNYILPRACINMQHTEDDVNN